MTVTGVNEREKGEGAVQLTSEQRDAYRQRGWLVVEGVFTAQEATVIGRLAEELARRELTSEAGTESLDYTATGQLIPRKLSQPFLKHESFRRFALDGRLQTIVRQLTGTQAVLLTDQIFLKPPRFGSAKPWHQDNAYFQCEPSDEVITAWVALDDVDEHNGCLRYIDGSHLNSVYEHLDVPDEPHNRTPHADVIDLSRESVAPVRRGGVVLHHSCTLHASGKNSSDQWRRAFATHWAGPDVTSVIETVSCGYYTCYPDLYHEAASME